MMRRLLGFSPKSTSDPPSLVEQETPPAPLPRHVAVQSSKGKHVAFVATPPLPKREHEQDEFGRISPALLSPSPDATHGLGCLSRGPTPDSVSSNSHGNDQQPLSLSDAQRPSQPHSLSNFHSHPHAHSHSTSRTVSALSTTPSQRSVGYSSTSPYEPGLSSSHSASRLALASDGTIATPTTWSEMVNEDLVDNLGAREKTRQEVLYEIVASEERFVVELRSLVECYVRPLLHPLLIPTPTSPLSPISTRSFTPSTSRTTELPIAAKFLRAVNPSDASSIVSRDEWIGRRASEIPEIGAADGEERWDGTVRQRDFAGKGRDGGAIYHSHSSSSLFDRSLPTPSSTAKPTSRLSLALRPRHPLRKSPSATKLHKKTIPKEELLHPVLPDELRKVLEVLEGMLEGHERLAVELRRKWIADFPLVRGLGGIWVDQPWFLDSYSTYILALESALATLDHLLPSPHSSHLHSQSPSKSRTKVEKDERKLSNFLMTLEEKAHAEGESGLAICLSKPLMRLGKLPLLMQGIFYHTDASTVEYEKTRVMAVEIDRLVRSIENEMIDEDEREKVRDLFARIDGIKDKGLMAPRSERILLEETSIWSIESNGTTSNVSPSSRNVSSLSKNSSRSLRRLSDLVRSGSSLTVGGGAGRGEGGIPRVGSKKDIWLITLTDVTIRVQRTGLTTLPSSLSLLSSTSSSYSPLSKSSKNRSNKRKGRERNLYRFLKVERWETRDLSGSYGRRRSESLRARGRLGGVDDGVEEGSSQDDDAESVMSFNYTNDEPTPNLVSRNFKLPFAPQIQQQRSVSHSSALSSLHTPTTTPREEARTKVQAQEAKFGSRMRSAQGWNRPGSSLSSLGAGRGGGGAGRSVSSPSSIGMTTTTTSRSKFDKPTLASLARSTTPTPFHPSSFSRSNTPLPLSPASSMGTSLPGSPGLLPVRLAPGGGAGGVVGGIVRGGGIGMGGASGGGRRRSLTPSLGTPGESRSNGPTPEGSPLLRTPPMSHEGLGLSLAGGGSLEASSSTLVSALVDDESGKKGNGGEERARGESSSKVLEGYWEEGGVIFPIQA